MRIWLIAMLTIAGLACPAWAGILSGDTTHGLNGWQGSVSFQSDNDELQVAVDYCVYAPGQFGQRFPGLDPSNGSQYIYAYQIDNTVNSNPIAQDYVSYFSVGTNTAGDKQIANVGFLSGSDAQPYFFHAYSSAVRWNFYDMAHPTGAVYYPSSSDILIFSSPFGPTWDNSTVSGATSKFLADSMPSPIPEPASLVLLLAGLAAFIRRRPMA